jgi:hypothetical protein
MKEISVPENTPNDVIWGAKKIADHIGRTLSQTYYLIRTKKIPAKKLGPRTIMARKSELDSALSKSAAGQE